MGHVTRAVCPHFQPFLDCCCLLFDSLLLFVHPLLAWSRTSWLRRHQAGFSNSHPLLISWLRRHNAGFQNSSPAPKRNLKTRIKEHFRNIKYNHLEKSVVATHHLINGHELNPVPKWLKNLTERSEMTMWENLLILKNKEQVMNFEIPPCNIFTKKFVIKPTEGVQTATTQPTGDNSSRETVENGGTLPLKYVP